MSNVEARELQCTSWSLLSSLANGLFRLLLVIKECLLCGYPRKISTSFACLRDVLSIYFQCLTPFSNVPQEVAMAEEPPFFHIQTLPLCLFKPLLATFFYPIFLGS